MATGATLERQLAKAGVLIVLGLTIEVVSSLFVHPLAFVVFLLLSCPLIIAGILLFLWGLVSSTSGTEASR